MKILAINSIYYIPISGINYSVKKLGEELVKKDHKYHILTLNMDHSEEECFQNGIKIIKLPHSKYNTLSGNESLSIVRFLQKNLDNYDIVHIHNYYSFWSLLAALICKLKKKPFVFTPYYHGVRGNIKIGINKYIYDFYKIFGKYIFKWACKVVCISEYEEKLIEGLIPVQKDRCMVIPPGVDYINLNITKEQGNGEIIRLLYVGNLFESKGVQHIIKSIPLLLNHYHNVNLSIVGDGIYKGTLLDLIISLNLNNYVDFYYNLSDEDLKKKYQDSDIFIFLSSSEAYGMVVAEALAMGTPCIVANEMALSEFTKEQGCFGVENPSDPNEIVSLILDIQRGNVKVGPFQEKILSWEKVADIYEKIYFKIVGSS